MTVRKRKWIEISPYDFVVVAPDPTTTLTRHNLVGGGYKWDQIDQKEMSAGRARGGSKSCGLLLTGAPKTKVIFVDAVVTLVHFSQIKKSNSDHTSAFPSSLQHFYTHPQTSGYTSVFAFVSTSVFSNKTALPSAPHSVPARPLPDRCRRYDRPASLDCLASIPYKQPEAELYPFKNLPPPSEGEYRDLVQTTYRPFLCICHSVCTYNCKRLTMPAQSSMPDISIPQARRIVVDTTGAQIVQEESPAVSFRLILIMQCC